MFILMYTSKLIARNPSSMGFFFGWLPNEVPGVKGPVFSLWALHLGTTHMGNPPGFVQIKICVQTHTHTPQSHVNI